jgi:hypothetical protein
MTTPQVAALFRVSTMTVKRWRAISIALPALKAGRHFAYEPRVVYEWLRQLGTNR